jgi:hypothetical protein
MHLKRIMLQMTLLTSLQATQALRRIVDVRDQHIKQLNTEIINQMINVKNVKYLSTCRTNATDHQDAYTVNKIIRSEIINVSYLRARTSNHAIICFLDAATIKIRISQIARCAKCIRQLS